MPDAGTGSLLKPDNAAGAGDRGVRSHHEVRMTNPLGYECAKRVVELGRGAFFESALSDFPSGRIAQLREHDQTPQFGFVGPRFTNRRVLLLGINPGKAYDDRITPEDSRMMQPLIEFARNPTVEKFQAASAAYMNECQRWTLWRQYCSEVVGGAGLAFDEIAYSNCLPWRTHSQGAFSEYVAQKAAENFAGPLIRELKPRVIVALGKRAGEILSHLSMNTPPIVVWNRARAATSGVKAERASAARRILALVSVANGA